MNKKIKVTTKQPQQIVLNKTGYKPKQHITGERHIKVQLNYKCAEDWCSANTMYCNNTLIAHYTDFLVLFEVKSYSHTILFSFCKSMD